MALLNYGLFVVAFVVTVYVLYVVRDDTMLFGEAFFMLVSLIFLLVMEINVDRKTSNLNLDQQIKTEKNVIK